MMWIEKTVELILLLLVSVSSPEFTNIYQNIEECYEIVEYDITDNPQSVYDNQFLCEALKEELDVEAQAQELLGSVPAEIDYFAYDFNADGLDDYIVVFSGIYWSGSAGETIRLYIQEEDDTLRKVFSVHSRIKGIDDYVPIAVLGEQIEGYYSFSLLSANGRVWKYNAETGKYDTYEREQLQDNVNQMFYGTWRYEEVVSQHSGLGGDTGYEELLGQTVVYEADYYECGGESIQNPKYEVAIYPISELGTFFVRQNGFAELFPATPYFVYIRITDKPSTVGGHGYHAVDFILQDENTLYCYDMNCIYKLVRVEYSQKYSEGEAPSYSEHW